VDGPLSSTTSIGANGISARMLRSRSGEFTFSAVFPTYKLNKEKEIAIYSAFMDASPLYMSAHTVSQGADFPRVLHDNAHSE